MKKLIQLSLAGLALLLGACSTIDSRIKQHPHVFYNLDKETQDKIAHGDIAIGFTPEMVYIALGHPDSKRQRLTGEGSSETWVYSTYYERYEGTAHLGYRRWVMPTPRGYRVYWEPVYEPVYSEQREDNLRVTFRDGKVAVIEQARS